MKKFEYSLMIAVCFLAFSSCSNFTTQSHNQALSPAVLPTSNTYGSYLAGRIAHYRQDFDTAADYYKQTARQDPKNTNLLNSTFLLLASQGRITEAAEYAQIAKKNGNTNEFIPIIIASEQFKKEQYRDSLKTIDESKSQLYKKLISPFVNAWAYAGLKQYDQAVAAIETLQKESGMTSLYHFHSGMLNDYFNKPDIARKHYEKIVENNDMELSVRSLEVICNFYLRHGEKEKAVALAKKYAALTIQLPLLKNIYQNTLSAEQQSVEPVITTPQIGLSEAMFNIAAVIKQNPEVLDFSHIFIRLALYENPQNDLARILLGGILEMREMYKDAINVYDEVPYSSAAYYIAQYKKSENLRNLNDYKGAELLLKSLIMDYPDDYQTLIDLGDVLRVQEKYKEALKYYKDALKKHHAQIKNMWQIYYALGMTYERLGEWHDAEKNLVKALQLSPNNLLVLNYLGYSWLQRGKSPEEAFRYIIKAYNQAPYNSSITDSLGWGFYRFGKYEDAINYLEKAVDSDPSNAVINDHLGDAYWQGGRKNEAYFQWNHALTLKDDSGELDHSAIKHKLHNGMEENKTLPYDTEKLQRIISEINT